MYIDLNIILTRVSSALNQIFRCGWAPYRARDLEHYSPHEQNINLEKDPRPCNYISFGTYYLNILCIIYKYMLLAPGSLDMT